MSFQIARCCSELCACLWSMCAPAKKTAVKNITNEQIQAKLENSSSEWNDYSPKFWDRMTDDTDDDQNRLHLQIPLSRLNQKGQAYDLGCGIGGDTRHLLSRGWEVTAVEIGSKAINILKQINSPYLEIIESSLETFKFTKKANLIIALDILAFCAPGKVRDIWNNIHAVLNKGGYLVCSLPVPNGGHVARWSLNRREMVQFFLDGKYEIIEETRWGVAFGDHPLFLVLQKI